MNRDIQPYRNDLKNVARRLRGEATFPERLLWSRLKSKQLGHRILRQRPIGNHVVDFFCPESALVIELDGRSHDGQFEADMERQRFLESQGLHVLRFSNDSVLHDLDGVVRQIEAWLSENPSLQGGGRTK